MIVNVAYNPKTMYGGMPQHSIPTYPLRHMHIYRLHLTCFLQRYIALEENRIYATSQFITTSQYLMKAA